MALRNDHLYFTDSETESDDLSEYFNFQSQKRINRGIYVGKAERNNKIRRNKKEYIADGENVQDMKAFDEESEIRKVAEKYQHRMELMPIPPNGTLPISFMAWEELAKSIGQKYEQPLHYLTIKVVKEWDEARIGSKEEKKALDEVIEPGKAEAAIWVVEQFHRQCTSADHLAKLWLSDPTYQHFIE